MAVVCGLDSSLSVGWIVARLCSLSLTAVMASATSSYLTTLNELENLASSLI